MCPPAPNIKLHLVHCDFSFVLNRQITVNLVLLNVYLAEILKISLSDNRPD